MPSFQSIRKAVKYTDDEGNEKTEMRCYYLPQDDASKVHPVKSGAPHPLIEDAISMGLVTITEAEILKIQSEIRKNVENDIAKRNR